MAPTRRLRKWSRHPTLFVVLAALSLLLASCTRPAEMPPPVYIRICGSSSMANLVDELTAAYVEEHPHVTCHTRVLNSREGLKAVLLGEADIGLVAHPLENTELLDTDTGECRLSATLITQDGIAIAVNAASPIEGLSLAQLRSIYTGETWNWSDLQGPSGEIAVVTREEGSGTREVFEQSILQEARLTPRAIIMPSAEAVALYVQQHPEAVGYLTAAYNMEGIKTLSLEGELPDKRAIRHGQYPLVRPFYVVTTAKPPDEVQAFVHFLMGRSGQAIVQRDRPGPR